MIDGEREQFFEVLDGLVKEYLDYREKEFDPEIALQNFIEWMDRRNKNDAARNARDDDGPGGAVP